MGKVERMGACEIYRITKPFSFFKAKNGWTGLWTDMHHLMQRGEVSSRIFWEQLQSLYDVFVFPRFFLPSGAPEMAVNLFSELSRNGKLVVYEVDDDYTNEHRKVIDGEAMAIAASCDLITVTTPMLGERMQAITGRPYEVLPNMLDPDLWFKEPPKRLHPDKLTIGLSGSPTHYNDWRVLETVIPRLLDTYPQAHLILTAFHPEYLKGLPNTTYLPALGYIEYAEMVKSCDIIVAPVDPLDRFNDSKSEIKTTEGQGAVRRLSDGRLAGAAVIATDNAVYRLGVKPGETGLLVQHTPEEWYQGLETLITNQSLRETLQLNGLKWVKQNRNIKTSWSKWTNAYQKHLALKSPQRIGGLHVPSSTRYNPIHRAAGR